MQPPAHIMTHDFVRWMHAQMVKESQENNLDPYPFKIMANPPPQVASRGKTG